MILIDARTLGPRPSGIGRHTAHLLAGIATLDAETFEAAGTGPVAAWVRPDAALPADVAGSPRLELIERTGRCETPGHQGAAPRELRRLGATLLHTPDAFTPLRSPCPTLVTVHDLIPLRMRRQLRRSWKSRLGPVWAAWLRAQARAAAGVVTVSEHSAREIRSLLRTPAERIHVIPNACAPAPNAGPPPPGLEPGDRFLLNVGRRDPYKNVPALVRGFAGLRVQRPDLTAGLRLVVAGPPDARYPEAEEEARRHGLGEAVLFTGFVAEATLARLYRDAEAVVLPSAAEGFGLPALEAMRCGTPVIAAAAGAVPEVVGDAAELFDPAAHDALVAALARVLGDPERSRALRRRGPARALRFTPEAAAEAHLRLYARLAAADG